VRVQVIKCGYKRLAAIYDLMPFIGLKAITLLLMWFIEF